MKLWVNKGDLDYFKEMQSEGRTRIIEISTFPYFGDDREIEIECKEVKK